MSAKSYTSTNAPGVKLTGANILTALDPEAIGTRVIDRATFMDELLPAIAAHDESADRASGQHFVHLGDRVNEAVSCGEGRRTDSPNDYVIREHRGQVALFLGREKAAPTVGCAAVVYTSKAYCADPDVQSDPGEVARVVDSGATHVLVAVLAFGGPSAEMSPYRFVANLAGGNREALKWSAAEIREKAAAIKARAAAMVQSRRNAHHCNLRRR